MNWAILEQFHFLRPYWLGLIPAAVLLYWVVGAREDVRSRWKGIVAPHLLDHLIVGKRSVWRFRPIHLICLIIGIGALALAGPTWERELPPFTEDKAPLVVVLSLSQSMDAIDVQPTRLERAKQKIRDLLGLRQGSRSALIVYSGTAHMVLPLTDDPSLIELFLSSLSTDLMPVQGRDAAAGLRAAEELLDREEVPGSILIVTDGIEAEDFSVFEEHSKRSHDQIIVLAVGTSQGGPILVGENRFRTDSAGRRVVTRMDVERFRQLQSQVGIPVTTATLDNKDVEWIQGKVQSHLEIVQQETAETRWRDFGYYLVLPIAILAALWFRRGWTVRWA